MRVAARWVHVSSQGPLGAFFFFQDEGTVNTKKSRKNKVMEKGHRKKVFKKQKTRPNRSWP